MDVGSLVKVRRGVGTVSGGIYAYSSPSLGGREDDLIYLFTHEDLGLIIEKSYTSNYEDIGYVPVAKILCHHGLGWVPRDYIEMIE